MSPEQATAERDVDGRSDIYSLGCVVYEMLAGEPPFTGPNPRAILSKQLSDRVRPVRRLRDGVPAHIDGALVVALGRSPADRFPDMTSFGAALEGSSGNAPRRRHTRLATIAAFGIRVAAASWAAMSRPRSALGMPSVRIQRFVPPVTRPACISPRRSSRTWSSRSPQRSARVFVMDSARLPSGFAVSAIAKPEADPWR